jgi:hypothetical protein
MTSGLVDDANSRALGALRHHVTDLLSKEAVKKAGMFVAKAT